MGRRHHPALSDGPQRRRADHRACRVRRAVPRPAGTTPGIFAGYIGLSGPYDFVLDSKLLRATFAGSAEREHDAQPVNFVRRDVPRTLLAMGRDDKTVRPRNTTSLVAHLRDVGASVEEVWVAGDHGVTVGAFARSNRGDSEVHRRIRDFVLAPREARAAR